MGRPKGSLNKKTVDKLKNLTGGGEQSAHSQDDIQTLKTRIDEMSKIISDLTDKLTQQTDPVKQKIVSRYNIATDLDSCPLLSQKEIDRLELEKAEAVRELQGTRKVLSSILGGTVFATEDKTGDKDELYKRLAMSTRALVHQTPPKLSIEERNRLKKEYDVLTNELRKVQPSISSCWQVGTPQYMEAIERIALMSTKYSRKIMRWQNIGKILDPENPSAWDIGKLAKK